MNVAEYLWVQQGSACWREFYFEYCWLFEWSTLFSSEYYQLVSWKIMIDDGEVHLGTLQYLFDEIRAGNF